MAGEPDAMRKKKASKIRLTIAQKFQTLGAWLANLMQWNKKNKSDAEVEKIIADIKEISSDGKYIYRGEPEKHKNVSSNLYREYARDGIGGAEEELGLDMKTFEEHHIAEVMPYIRHAPKTDKDGILTELQHYGGITNQIDFTRDYLIALFFACRRNPEKGTEKDGRVILLKKEEEKGNTYKVQGPRGPQSRIVAQKSVFVWPEKGFIDKGKYKEVIIKESLKKNILKYLRKNCDISSSTIFNDLHGFIETYRTHKDARKKFRLGIVRYSEAVRARGEKKEGLLREAIDCCTEAIELNPDYAAAYDIRGLTYADLGEHERAIEDYTEAIELNPDYAGAYINRGNVYDKLGKPDLALRDYNKAIELEPNLAAAYINRGLAYLKLGEHYLALKDFNKAIELNPNDATAYSNRGIVYGKRGEHDLALKDFNKAIELEPNDATAYNNRGLTYAELKKPERALEDYNKAIDLNPNYATAYNNRGAVYLELGEPDLALRDYDKAIELDPNVASAYYNRGLLYSRRGEHDLALKDCNKAIELNPNYATAYCVRGLAHLVLKKFPEAKKDLEAAVDKGLNVPAAFRMEFGSIAAFEKKYKVKIPPDIADILEPPQQPRQQ